MNVVFCCKAVRVGFMAMFRESSFERICNTYVQRSSTLVAENVDMIGHHSPLTWVGERGQEVGWGERLALKQVQGDGREGGEEQRLVLNQVQHDGGMGRGVFPLVGGSCILLPIV